MNVKPKNQQRVNHEDLTSSKNLDRLPRFRLEKKMVMKAGNMVGSYLRPHDLRRHAATYESQSGVPIEIISKLILRHANLSITQLYLGRISDTEAVRWIENLYA